MYVGRIVAVGRNRENRLSALYRVSSRSFPNREARILGDRVAVLPKPGHECDIYKNPYIAYNCLSIVGDVAVATNGSHTDFIAEKIAAGYPVRDALISVLHAMDYEHDSLNTPRIAAVVDRSNGLGHLGIVTDQTLHVHAFELALGTAYYVATYEKNVPTTANVDDDFSPESAEDACQYMLGQGVMADFERPITAACAVEVADGSFEVAVADAPR